MSISAFALFCEDIRQEKSGQLTIIGLLPDNIVISNRPVGTDPATKPTISKLGIYFRIHIDPDDEVPALIAKLILPNKEEFDLGEIDNAVVQTAKEQANANQIPIAGIIHHVVMHGFSVPKYGLVKATLQAGSELQLCGVLNLIEDRGSA